MDKYYDYSTNEKIPETFHHFIAQLAAIIHASIEDITETVSSPDKLMNLNPFELMHISEKPEVSRKCPFCGKQHFEHYFLARHIAEKHPKEAMKKYEKSIKHYYKHPEDVGERHQMITKLFTENEHIDEDLILCPFCEEPFPEHELKKHVNQQHGEFMEAFYNVLKEGGK